MKRIFSLCFLFFSFLGQSQNVQNEINILHDKINQFEKSGDTLNDQYGVIFNDLGYLYQKQKKYENAESVFLKAIKITENNKQNKPLYFSESCFNLAQLYQIQENYSKAEPLYLNALEIIEKNSDTNSFIYPVILNNLGVLYHYKHKYSDSEHFHLKAIELKKKNLETKPLEYAFSLFNLALVYEEENKYSEAEFLFLKVIEIEKNVLGENNLKYAESLNYLGEFYCFNKKNVKAEPFFLKSLSIRKGILGEKNIDYTTSLNNLGELYGELKKYSEAESLLLDALKIRLKILGKNNKPYLKTLENLAIIYAKQAKYSQAEPLFLEVLDIKKTMFGESNWYYVQSLKKVAFFYQSKGNFYQAEPFFLKVIEINKKIFGEKHLEYAKSLDEIGVLYYYQEKYSKAEIADLKALEIKRVILGDKHHEYNSSLNNLGTVYIKQKKYIDAEVLYLRILDNEKLSGEILSESCMNNLAYVYEEQKKYSQAESLYLETLQFKEELLGKKNKSYGITLKNLALLYRKQGKYIESESLFLESLEVKRETLGENHPDYLMNLLNLAVSYRIIGLNEKSSQYFEQFSKINQNRLLDDFYFMSEKELIEYINLKKKIFFSPLSFLNDFPSNYPKINSISLDNEIVLKGLSLRNQKLLKKSIQKSGNKSLQIKYHQYLTNKIEIKKLIELPCDKRPNNFEILTKATEQIEKELSIESTTFYNYKKELATTFNDLKSKLKKNEMVIDLVSFNYYKKKASDSIVYAVFIVKNDSKFPKFISLFEEKQLDFLLLINKNQQDSTRINKQYIDKSISDLFLNPFVKELEGINTIYLTPSGLGHQINFSALPINESQTLGDKYKLHILNTPSELIDYKEAILVSKNKPELLLYGGIDYGKSDAKEKEENTVAAVSDEFINIKTRSSIKGFDYIEGTNIEVNQIQHNANQNGFSTRCLNESSATEESIKTLDGRTTPYVLHLATHGFFFEDPHEKELPKSIFELEGKAKVYKTANDPMMRSGLVLAGVNNFWSKTNENSSIEDGILTASEISNLDLSSCQLVVLSACETGLGEVKGSEGVFGLQRAFKMAGVKNIIMSLWKVPDTQTAELFDIFYSECFTGKSIHEAFQLAQSKMKAKYSPYYWAGFVLLE
jgi:CHAT domain-containing protein